MKTVFHAADTRGVANHGWLKSRHTFSFANYHHPDRVHFGALRVLNDDEVAGGGGFGTHPHSNMEIISLPLSGDLAHKDSMGNGSVIKSGDIQVMSAGTGVAHSEMNASADTPVKFLQIWVFPRENGVTPRYQQISLGDTRGDGFRQILSPNADDEGVWIHQDAWFSLADWQAGNAQTYRVKKTGNGVYAFVLEGEAEIAGHPVNARDGLGVWETDSFAVKANSDARILLMDVPMAL